MNVGERRYDTAYTDVAGPILVFLMFLPALVLVLRRPNEGDTPRWLERIVEPVERAAENAWRRLRQG